MAMFRQRLEAFVSRYIKTTGLSLSLWSGNVEIDNAVLNVEALQSLLPVRIASADLRFLRITIPWTQLLSDSITLQGSGLVVELVAENGAVIGGDGGSDDKRAHAADTPPPSVHVHPHHEDGGLDAAALLFRLKGNFCLDLSEVHLVLRAPGDGGTGDMILHLRCATLTSAPLEETSATALRQVAFTALSLETQCGASRSLLVEGVAGHAVLHLSPDRLRYCNVVLDSALHLQLSSEDAAFVKHVLAQFGAVFQQHHQHQQFEQQLQQQSAAVSSGHAGPVDEGPGSPLRDSGVASSASPSVSPTSSPLNATARAGWGSSVWAWGRSLWSQQRMAFADDLNASAIGGGAAPPDESSFAVDHTTFDASSIAATDDDRIWWRVEVDECAISTEGVTMAASQIVLELSHAAMAIECSVRVQSAEVRDHAHCSTAAKFSTRSAWQWVGQWPTTTSMATTTATALLPPTPSTVADADASESAAICIDYVNRPTTHFCEIYVAPLELSLRPSTMRALARLVAILQHRDDDTNGGASSESSSESSPLADTAEQHDSVRVGIRLDHLLVRACVSDATPEMQFDVGHLVHQNGDWMLRDVSLRVDGHVLLSPLAVDVKAREHSVLLSGAQLAIAPGWLRAALYTASMLSNEFAEAKRRTVAPAPHREPHPAAHAEWRVRCPSTSVDVLVDGRSVASVLLLQLQVTMLSAHVTGSVASLSVRAGDAVLVQSFAIEGTDEAAVTFGSRSQTSAPHLSVFSHLDVRVCGVRVDASDTIAWSHVLQAMRAGVSGLSEQHEHHIACLSRAQLLWRWAASAALRREVPRDLWQSRGRVAAHWRPLLLYLQSTALASWSYAVSHAVVVLRGRADPLVALELKIGSLVAQRAQTGMLGRQTLCVVCKDVALALSQAGVATAVFQQTLPVQATSPWVWGHLCDVAVSTDALVLRTTRLVAEQAATILREYGSRGDKQSDAKVAPYKLRVDVDRVCLAIDGTTAKLRQLRLLSAGQPAVATLSASRLAVRDEAGRVAVHRVPDAPHAVHVRWSGADAMLQVTLHQYVVRMDPSALLAPASSPSASASQPVAWPAVSVALQHCAFELHGHVLPAQGLVLDVSSASVVTAAPARATLWCAGATLNAPAAGSVALTNLHSDVDLAERRVDLSLDKLSVVLESLPRIMEMLRAAPKRAPSQTDALQQPQRRPPFAVNASLRAMSITWLDVSFALSDAALVSGPDELRASILGASVHVAADWTLAQLGQVSAVRGVGSGSSVRISSLAVSVAVSQLPLLRGRAQELATAMRAVQDNDAQPPSPVAQAPPSPSVALPVTAVLQRFEATMFASPADAQPLLALTLDVVGASARAGEQRELSVAATRLVHYEWRSGCRSVEVFAFVHSKLSVVESRADLLLSERNVALTLEPEFVRCAMACAASNVAALYPLTIHNGLGADVSVLVTHAWPCAEGCTAGWRLAPDESAFRLRVECRGSGRAWLSGVVRFATHKQATMECASDDGDVMWINVECDEMAGAVHLTATVVLVNTSGMELSFLHRRPLAQRSELHEEVVLGRSDGSAGAYARSISVATAKGKEEMAQPMPVAASRVTGAEPRVALNASRASTIQVRVAQGQWSRPISLLQAPLRCEVVPAGDAVALAVALYVDPHQKQHKQQLCVHVGATALLRNRSDVDLLLLYGDAAASAPIELPARSETRVCISLAESIRIRARSQLSADADEAWQWVGSLGALCSATLAIRDGDGAIQLQLLAHTQDPTGTRMVTISSAVRLVNALVHPALHALAFAEADSMVVTLVRGARPFAPLQSQGEVALRVASAGAIAWSRAFALDPPPADPFVVHWSSDGADDCSAVVAVSRDGHARCTSVEVRPHFRVRNAVERVSIAVDGCVLAPRNVLDVWQWQRGDDRSVAVSVVGAAMAPADEGLNSSARVVFNGAGQTVLQYAVCAALLLTVTRTPLRAAEKGSPNADDEIGNDDQAFSFELVVSDCRVPSYVLDNRTDWTLALEQHSVAPHSVRHAYPPRGAEEAWMAKLRLAPNGNWSEPMDCARVRVATATLYGQEGSRAVVCHFERRGGTNVVRFETPPPPQLQWVPSNASLTRWWATVTVCPATLSVTMGNAARIVLQRPSVVLNAVSSSLVTVSLGADWMQVRNLVSGAAYPLMLSSNERPVLLRARYRPDTGHVSNAMLAVPQLRLQLDYESLSQLSQQLAAMFAPNVGSHSGAAGGGHALFVDSAEICACAATLTWKNPRPLFPLPRGLLPDSVLYIRDAELHVSAITWDGPHSLPLGRLVRGIVWPSLRASLLQHTLSIVGSLDIVGNPTAALQSLRASLSAFSDAGTAALLGRASDALSRTLDGTIALIKAPLLPLLGLGSAAGRLIDYSRLWVAVATTAEHWGAPVRALLDFHFSLAQLVDSLVEPQTHE